jgi:FAD/FMN-containing dehydrogenase
MTAVTAMPDRLEGSVIVPGDPDYEAARHVHNSMIDKRPVAIVRCANASDVQAVVEHARNCAADLAVRGGGHSVPGFGTADDAFVVDLSGMNHVLVDPDVRTARVGGGATWGTFNDIAGTHGLATTGGIVSTTGVSGLTLGGGIGYLARAHGLSCDNLLSAEVVLADGSIVTASENRYSDLFWALRGGGGNFGVVTEFEFRLHSVSKIFGGPMAFEVADAAEVLRYFDNFITTAPRAYYGFPGWQQAAPLPFIPANRVGEPFMVVMHCWTGDPDEGARVIEAFREIARPAAEFLGPIPYPVLNSLFDAFVPPGLQHYWKAVYVKDLTDEAIAAHVEHGPRVPVVNSTMHLYPINGACHDIAPDATAFGHRDASYACVVAGMWPDAADSEANIGWVRDYYGALVPLSEPGGYVNFASADDQRRVRDNFGAGYERLAQIKRRYDPDNVFHINQNIEPASG